MTGLDNVRVIDGDLYIYQAHFQSLQGLGALEEIGGTLHLSEVPDLQDIEALESLRTVGGDLDVYWDGDLSPLGGLESVGGWLSLSDNRYRSSRP